jgi:hypothetical protein
VIDETVGEALRRWRTQRGLTLRQLAERIHYSHVYLWEIEKGAKQPPTDLIALCDRHLDAGGQLVAIAAAARCSTEQAAAELGLHSGTSWMECIETVTALWQHDAGRRKLLRGSMFVPAALTASVKTWWLPAEHQLPDVGSADVDSLTRMITTFRRLDNLYGGGEVRAAVVQFLDSEVGPILQRHRLESLGRNYLSAVAELTQLAGWFAYDSLQHGLAQRYFIQALQLARWANDRALGAEVLNAMSHQAIFLRKPRRALDLAQAAHKTAASCRMPSLMAEASVMTARAHALQGQHGQCVTALGEAEQHMNGERGGDPQWMAYFDEAYLAAFVGHCYRALGNGALAERAARRSLVMDENYARGRLFNQILLAESHVLSQDIEQACVVGSQALNQAADVSSARAVVFIDRLVQDLKPWRTQQAVKEFVDQARLVSA